MNRLDLHGVKHQEVQNLLDSFIWENMNKKSDYIEIITGNSDQMKKIVKTVLSEYGMEASEEVINNGSLIVHL